MTRQTRAASPFATQPFNCRNNTFCGPRVPRDQSPKTHLAAPSGRVLNGLRAGGQAERPKIDLRLGYHQPENCQDCPERRKPEGKPQAEKLMVPLWEGLARMDRLRREIAHPHLH